MLCSPTVDRFVHHLKFCFLANNTAFVWPTLFLERKQRQHFSPKAIADLDQFYIPRILQPVSFALCLTREHHLVATLLSGLHSILLPPFVPSAACTQCTFPFILLCYQAKNTYLAQASLQPQNPSSMLGRAGMGAWNNFTAPYLTQGEGRMLPLSFVVVKSFGWWCWSPWVCTGVILIQVWLRRNARSNWKS